MKRTGFIGTIITALLVVAFGWGSGFAVLKGVEVSKGKVALSAVAHKITAQTAAITQAIAAAVSNTFEDDTESGSNTAPASIETPAKAEATAQKPEPESNELTIMIAGDIMFDRNIRALGEQNGYESLFDQSVIDLFSKADIAVANLEGPITSHPSKTLVDGQTNKSLTFTFATSTAQILARAGIDIVSLANNHTDNFLATGYSETQKWLSRAGVEWFGNPWNGTSTSLRRNTADELETDGSFGALRNSPITTIVHKNGFTIAFVGYHAFQTGIDHVISEIKRVSGDNIFTIVMPHWGEEYANKPSDRQKTQAQAFAAAGADAIIGSHPHVIMSNEWIDGIPVYYSLGNLLFDQYFSPEVMKGNIAELHLVKNGTSISLDSLVLHETATVPTQGVKLADPAKSAPSTPKKR